jgi:plastocyanin
MIMSRVATILILAATASPALADGTITGIVDAKPAKFLKDTIVYVKSIPGAKADPKVFDIDQKGMEFSPHIVIAAVGDTVKFHNHDNVDHNVMSPDGGYDLGVWGLGATKEQKFAKAGVYSQVCKLHPEMLGYVFVGQNRAAAIVDVNGNFTIAGLPAGTYELDVWNPKLKASPQQVMVAADGKATVKFAITR